MAANLAPIYVNDSRVTLQGDPKPQVSKIIQAMGKQPNSCEVVRLSKQSDVQGKTMNPEDFIDRTQAEAPVYLKCVDRNVPSSAAVGKTGGSPGGGSGGSGGPGPGASFGASGGNAGEATTQQDSPNANKGDTTKGVGPQGGQGMHGGSGQTQQKKPEPGSTGSTPGGSKDAGSGDSQPNYGTTSGGSSGWGGSTQGAGKQEFTGKQEFQHGQSSGSKPDQAGAQKSESSKQPGVAGQYGSQPGSKSSQTDTEGGKATIEGSTPPGKGKTPRDDDPTFGEEE